MFDHAHTHPFVRRTLASVCGLATDRGASDLRIDRPRALDTALGFYRQPGIRFATREDRERPLSRDGAVTCHFSQTSISKTSPILAMIRAASTGRRYSGSGACAHVSYIERPGAAERLFLPQGRPVSGRDGLQQQAYLERDGAVEADPDDSLALASFGTIGETPEVRMHFWDLVEETERSPQGDRVTIEPAQNPDWWAKARGAIDEAPETARTQLRAAGAGAPAPVELTLSTKDALALWRWAEGVGTGAPIKIVPGRGGRTQTRIIAELPHEVDSHARLAIVKAFTGKLAARGFPYWAVVHAPDANNDRRNVHVHVVYYDRPARRMPDPETSVATWDFAITQEKRRANRTKVLKRPYRQPKDRASHDRAWIKELRTHWGTCCNAVLTEAGIGKRYDLRSYATIGIDQVPGVHIPARQYNKERKGSLTEAGSDLARRQWQAEADRILDDRARMTGEKLSLLLVQGRHAELTAFDRGGTADRKGDASVGRVRNLIRRGLTLVEEIGRLELVRDLAALVIMRTLSRPRLLLAAGVAPVRGPHATVDSGHPAPENPAVPGGERSGDADRSDLVRFCDDLEKGAAQLATVYEARIAEQRGRLVRIRTDLAGLEPMTGPVRGSALSFDRTDPALTGDGDPASSADAASPPAPIDPVPATLFAARVRASLDPGTAALWARCVAVEPEVTEAVAVTPSLSTILRQPTPMLVPEAPLQPDRSPVERAASHAPSWSYAVDRAAERHAARSKPAGPDAGEPALRKRPQPPFDLTIGQARRSNGAPLIPPGRPAIADVAAATGGNARGDLPIAPQAEARRAASLPASDVNSADAAAAMESTATMASASMPATAARRMTVAPTVAAIAPPPIVHALPLQTVETASVEPVPVAAAVEQAASVPPPARNLADRMSMPAASDPVSLTPTHKSAIEIELHLSTSASEGGSDPRVETPMAPREPIAVQAPIETVERDDEGDAPWPLTPQIEAPAPAVRVTPSTPTPTEALPRRVPISAVHETEHPASRARNRTAIRRRPTRSRNGREIGD